MQFPGPTGPYCVEAAIKLARKVTERHCKPPSLMLADAPSEEGAGGLPLLGQLKLEADSGAAVKRARGHAKTSACPDRRLDYGAIVIGGLAGCRDEGSRNRLGEPLCDRPDC